MSSGDSSGWFALHLADCRAVGEGCWYLQKEQGQFLPTAPRVAAEKPVEELEKHHVEQDILCSGAAQRAGSWHTAIIHGGEREVLLESQKEQAQYESKKKALDLDESTPENDSTMSAREFCL